MADLQDPKIGRRWTESQPEMGLPVRNPLKPRIAKKCRASDKLQGYFWCNFQLDTAQKEVSRWDHYPVIADCTRNSSLIFQSRLLYILQKTKRKQKNVFSQPPGSSQPSFFWGLKKQSPEEGDSTRWSSIALQAGHGLHVPCFSVENLHSKLSIFWELYSWMVNDG